MKLFAKLRARDEFARSVDNSLPSIFNLLLTSWPILENKVLTRRQSIMHNKEHIQYPRTTTDSLHMSDSEFECRRPRGPYIKAPTESRLIIFLNFLLLKTFLPVKSSWNRYKNVPRFLHWDMSPHFYRRNWRISYGNLHNGYLTSFIHWKVFGTTRTIFITIIRVLYFFLHFNECIYR